MPLGEGGPLELKVKIGAPLKKTLFYRHWLM